MTLALAVLVAGGLVVFGPGRARAQIPVPSGVPTQAPGAPVNVGVASTQLNLSGCASPGAFIQIFNGSSLAGTATANGQGRFNKKITVNNQDAGLHSIRLFYQDVNHRTSSIVSQVVNLSSQSDTALELLLPTTIEHEPEPVVAGDYLIFRGSTCPGALVNVRLDNNLTLAALADSKGNWYVIANTSNYYSGGHVYEASSHLGSKSSQASQKYQFNVGGGQPGAGPSDLSAPVIIEPTEVFLSSQNVVTVRGTGPINSQIEIFADGRLVGSVFTNAFGDWSFNLTLTALEQVVTTRACWRSDCGSPSNQVRIQYVGTAPFCRQPQPPQTADSGRSVLAQTDVNLDQPVCVCDLNLSLTDYRFFDLRAGDGLDLSVYDISGAADFEVLLDWGDAAVEHLTLATNHATGWHHVYQNAGHYNGSLTVRDANGCRQIRYFSVVVGGDTRPNWWFLSLIPLAGGGVYLAAHFVNAYQASRSIPAVSSPSRADRPLGWPSNRPWPKAAAAKDKPPRG